MFLCFYHLQQTKNATTFSAVIFHYLPRPDILHFHFLRVHECGSQEK